MKTPTRATSLGLRLALVALGVVAITACEKRLDNVKAPKQQVSSTTVTTTTTTPSSGNLIGTAPAPSQVPEGTTETTPVPPERQLGAKTSVTVATSSANNTEITKHQEVNKMPLPGQPNDHSNVAPDGSQRAGQTDPQASGEREQTSTAPPKAAAQ